MCRRGCARFCTLRLRRLTTLNFFNEFRYDHLNQLHATIRSFYFRGTDRLKQISAYRHTDYGLILSSAVLGIAVGVAIVVFHLVVSFFEGIFDKFFLAANTHTVLRYVYFPFIVATGVSSSEY